MGQPSGHLPIADDLKDQFWRLNNLYRIKDKAGKEIQFRMNWAQEQLYHEMWYLNDILKARQLGFTTFIDLFILDTCLFNANITAGIIAHNLEDAKVIFREKIKFPYDKLPDKFKTSVVAQTDRAGELMLSNGSSIRVSTSMRSGTVQILHVSEYGNISKKYPQKAREIKTGAFEAVAQGQMIFVESTAEGRSGAFYDLTKTAQDLQKSGKKLTKLDFKFFFFPWWKNPEYQLEDYEDVVINQRMQDYFKRLKQEHGIVLLRAQKAWYVKKEASLGSDIKREHPSTPEEAFEESVEGAYFAKQMAAAREQGRITSVPHQPGVAVDTWWDLGMNDMNTIWFTQTVGREIHVIDYYENCGEGLAHYASVLSEKKEELGYHYGTHNGPHDLEVRELGTGKSRVKTASDLGIAFNVIPRVSDKLDSIEAARNTIPLCWFDESRCEAGITHLDSYRKEWDDIRGVWKSKPRHDEHSNGADGFQSLAMGHPMGRRTGKGRAQATAPPSAGGWT